jgi:hypothetical protein
VARAKEPHTDFPILPRPPVIEGLNATARQRGCQVRSSALSRSSPLLRVRTPLTVAPKLRQCRLLGAFSLFNHVPGLQAPPRALSVASPRAPRKPSTPRTFLSYRVRHRHSAYDAVEVRTSMQLRRHRAPSLWPRPGGACQGAFAARVRLAATGYDLENAGAAGHDICRDMWRAQASHSSGVRFILMPSRRA